MQRGFGGKNCPQNAKINHSKTVEKSMNSDQNKIFFKKSKKSVAKIVRLMQRQIFLFFNDLAKKIPV